MEEKIYALRNISFWYDDEYYYPLWNASDHIGHITAIFSDKEQAIEEWKRLEYDFTYRVNFNNFMSEGTLYQLENILPNYQDDDLSKLNKDELFDVIHEIGCHVYYLYEYPKNTITFPEWDNQKNDYEITDATTEIDFRTNYFIEFCVDQKNYCLNGNLTDLSDTPILLSQLIRQDKNLEYDEDNKQLIIQPNSETLNSLNTLLKNPIRFLTIEEIYKIEQKINHTHNNDYGYKSGD